jgi:hypothetical protein
MLLKKPVLSVSNCCAARAIASLANYRGYTSTCSVGWFHGIVLFSLLQHKFFAACVVAALSWLVFLFILVLPPFFIKCHIWFVLSQTCVSLTINFKKII